MTKQEDKNKVSPGGIVKDEKVPAKVKDNMKKSTVPDGTPTDNSIEQGYTDQHQNNEGTTLDGLVGGELPKKRDQHIRNTKEAGIRARENYQEPNLSDSEANAAYRYVEPAFPPTDADVKK